MLVEILGDPGEILAFLGKMLSIACFPFRPRLLDVEVGDMPVFQEVAEGLAGWEFRELCEPFEREDIR
ncbi:MAG: hypothetical protein WCQ50_19920 [Spirochaetota bacterium]